MGVSENQGPHYGTQTVGLLQGHPQKGHPFLRNCDIGFRYIPFRWVPGPPGHLLLQGKTRKITVPTADYVVINAGQITGLHLKP